MKLPVTPEERFQWGDIEGLLWAYATRRLARGDVAENIGRHFEWKTTWGRELYEDVIATSGGGPPLDPERERIQYHRLGRTLWAANVLNYLRPARFLDFGCGYAGQTAAFLDLCPSITSVLCRELVTHGQVLGEPFVRARYGPRFTGWECGGSFDMDGPKVDAINAQEVLEHVFDLDLVLEGLRRRLVPGGVLIASFPFGDWEARAQWPELRGHVRLVMEQDCRELFAGHNILSLETASIEHLSPRGWPWGWTLCAVQAADRPFGRINWQRHWEALG